MEIQPAAEAPTVDDLLAELAAAVTPQIEPDEVTARMLAERTGRGFLHCKRMLDDKVMAGELTARQVVRDGRRTTAYRKAVQDS